MRTSLPKSRACCEFTFTIHIECGYESASMVSSGFIYNLWSMACFPSNKEKELFFWSPCCACKLCAALKNWTNWRFLLDLVWALYHWRTCMMCPSRFLLDKTAPKLWYDSIIDVAITSLNRSEYYLCLNKPHTTKISCWTGFCLFTRFPLPWGCESLRFVPFLSDFHVNSGRG